MTAINRDDWAAQAAEGENMHWRKTLNRFVSVCLLFACAGGLHAASTILVASNRGPVKSTDGGITWSVIPVNVNSGLLSGQPTPNAVAVDPKTPSTWYFTGYAGVWGFYKSLDSGQTWTGIPLLSFVPFPGPGSIVIDPVATNTIYMRVFVGSTFFVVKSTDSGATWSTLRLPNTANFPADRYPAGAPPLFITTDPKISGVVYAISDYIFKSVDFGATWSVLSTGVDSSVAGTFPELARLDVDPRNSQVLYASASAFFESSFCKSTPTGGECGLYKSVDGGQT
jgi:BNR/Asp-box repeat